MSVRILVAGLSASIHLARWLGALDGLGWDVQVFPVSMNPYVSAPVGRRLAGVTVWDHIGDVRPVPGRGVMVRRLPAGRFGAALRLAGVRLPAPRALAEVIRSERPDVLHAMEFQHVGYLVEEALRLVPDRERPPLIVSSYGSDLYLFGRLPEHQPRIRALLAAADVFHPECAREFALARSLGFAGVDSAVIPMSAGLDVDAARVHRQPGPPSARRTIALKGYEHFAGRAGTAIEALRRCGRRLEGWRLEVHSPAPGVLARAVALGPETGLEVRSLRGAGGGPAGHGEMLALYGRARFSLALSISDGICTALLEAMAMGALPIQSWTACADEWVEDGVSGLLVPPEDPEPVAAAILRAMEDDALVDRAAEINLRTVEERLGWNVVREQIVALYERTAAMGTRARPG